MLENYIQTGAEKIVLEYKLNKIREYINGRKNIVDPITKIEFEILLKMIDTYEEVPIGWTLETPLVSDLPENLEEENIENV